MQYDVLLKIHCNHRVPTTITHQGQFQNLFFASGTRKNSSIPFYLPLAQDDPQRPGDFRWLLTENPRHNDGYKYEG